MASGVSFDGIEFLNASYVWFCWCDFQAARSIKCERPEGRFLKSVVSCPVAVRLDLGFASGHSPSFSLEERFGVSRRIKVR